MSERGLTLRAVDEYDGTEIVFDDYARHGELVEIDGRGPRIVFREDDDWYLRPLNDAEREQLIERVMSRSKPDGKDLTDGPY